MTTTSNNSYSTGNAVEQAIKNAARQAHKDNPQRAVQDIIRQTQYDRFLCRIFSEAENDWVLKGGTAMLARIPNTRRTLDADLFRKGYDLQQSLDDLKRLALLDLHDFFRFSFLSAEPIMQGGNQPYSDGYRVNFAVHIGTKKLENIHIDLVTHQGVLDTVEIQEPKNRISLPKLETHTYRLFPIANQIADKARAVCEHINGRASSRVKDIVDLTIILVSQDFDAQALLRAMRSECGKRHLSFPLQFTVPTTWNNRQFQNSAKETPAESYSLSQASMLITTMLHQLPQQAATSIWNHTTLQWESRITPEKHNYAFTRMRKTISWPWNVWKNMATNPESAAKNPCAQSVPLKTIDNAPEVTIEGRLDTNPPIFTGSR